MLLTVRQGLFFSSTFERDAQEGIDIALTIGQPIIGKDNQRMNAIGPIIDRQLDAWQQRNPLVPCCLAQRFEFIEVELVVIGDDAQANARVLQRIHIVAVVEVGIARVIELAVCPGVQMKVCAYPLCPFFEDKGSSPSLLWWHAFHHRSLLYADGPAILGDRDSLCFTENMSRPLSLI